MLKGQTQAVTAVLITSITLGAVATTYVWGTPILEKREAEQELVDTEQQLIDLREEIEELSQSGEGATIEYNLDVPSDTSIEVVEGSKKSSDDMDNNYIELRMSSDTSPYASDTWFLIDGASLQGLSMGAGIYGIEGDEAPGIVGVRSQGLEDSAFLTYRLEFRNIRANTPVGERMELIELDLEGGSQATGDTTFILRNEGVVEESGEQGVELETGENIPHDKTQISVNIQ